MASIRFVDVRPTKSYHIRESRNVQRFQLICSRMLVMSSATRSQYSRSNRLLENSGSVSSFAGINALVSPRLFPSGKCRIPQGMGSTAESGGAGVDWNEKFILGAILVAAFSSQVIVIKSRAQWRSIVKKIPLRIDDIDKIPQISEDIKSMLRSNPNVFLEKEAPYCFLSQIERSHAELTLGCNFKEMSKDAEHDILMEAVRIVKQHGAMLGNI